jgi:hypothetical protein
MRVKDALLAITPTALKKMAAAQFLAALRLP